LEEHSQEFEEILKLADERQSYIDELEKVILQVGKDDERMGKDLDSIVFDIR